MFDGSSHARNRRTLCGARASSLAAFLCVAAVVSACDESFDPTAPSDLTFSVFGYLDASADTQWIRVMPIRPLKVTSQDALGVTVTLEHLGTGRSVELRDSLFSFSSSADPDWGADGAHVHNFWTLEDIEPGAAYRLSARLEGKEPAEAVVEIPRDYEVEVAINQVRGPGVPDELRITGAKHLPFLTTEAFFYDGCVWDVSTIPHEGRSAENQTHLIAIEKQEVTLPTGRTGCGELWVANRELWIVGSATEWPAGGYSQGALGESGLTSNVTNAVGFLGGVLTKVIPYEDCVFQSDGVPIPGYCRLRYGSETARVIGTIREELCVGPLDSVVVQMTELNREPARIRTVLSNGAGEFLIGALEPGISHSLWVRAPPVPIDSVFNVYRFTWEYSEWFDIHTLHTDTVTFLPGQRLEYDIRLERLLPCEARTLIGTVTEAGCGDGPIDSATVELTELYVPDYLIPRTLTGRTNRNGEYLITGLHQYLHELRVRGPDVVVDSVYNPETGGWDPVLANVYTERVDSLRFRPDQVVKYDVRLSRLTPCNEPPPGAK
jgi:hypothetical protein